MRPTEDDRERWDTLCWLLPLFDLAQNKLFCGLP